MLEIRKTAVALDEKGLLELERIIVDSDEKGAMRFLKKSVYDKITHSQQGKLKSHSFRQQKRPPFIRRPLGFAS